ncbi:MAG: SgcJ/EcaC family oxidoreductase [Pseudomonadota bacterium]
MNTEQQAVEHLLNQFALHADRQDAQALAELFLEQGCLAMAGVELDGAVAIADFCRQRFQGGKRMTRHAWSNLHIERLSPAELASTIVQITYEHVSDEAAMQVRVNDVADRFRLDADGQWRFARREIRRVLSFSGPVA